MNAQNKASINTISWLLYNMVIDYHKLHYLNCSLPPYLTGISFEKEYDPSIRDIIDCHHTFRLFRQEFPLTHRIVNGNIALSQGGRFIYFVQIVYTDKDAFKPLGYVVKSIKFLVP